jgi:hypothetical protein
VGVGDAWGALALALALVMGGAAGGHRGEGWWVVEVSVVLTASGGGSFGAASGFGFTLGLTVVARLVGAVGNAVVWVEC